MQLRNVAKILRLVRTYGDERARSKYAQTLLQSGMDLSPVTVKVLERQRDVSKAKAAEAYDRLVLMLAAV
jgi:hypothetical protein